MRGIERRAYRKDSSPVFHLKVIYSPEYELGNGRADGRVWWCTPVAAVAVDAVAPFIGLVRSPCFVPPGLL